jgi:putative phosphoesterase
VNNLIVGIMADTHDRLPLIEKALKYFKKKEVNLVLHAGDYISPFVIPSFKHSKDRMIGVLGNNDGERNLLMKGFADIGARLYARFVEVRFDGLKIAMLHGEDMELLNSIINTQSFDVIIHGHTHKADTYKRGKTLIINPGEVCGYLTGRSTISILETEALKVETIQLNQ